MTVNAKNGFLIQDGKWTNQELVHPVSLLILNLMPTKRETELQFLRLLNALDQDIEVTFMYAASHHFKSLSKDRVARCYCSLQQIENNHYDGLVITGAPVEQIDFEAVDYWAEFIQIKRWADDHVGQTINECWASQAALYHDFAVPKTNLKHKLFGIYQATQINPHHQLSTDLTTFNNPQSRHSQSIIDRNALPDSLEIIADNCITGPMILHADDKRQTYVTGHPEYRTTTLEIEYQRDCDKAESVLPPVNYYGAKHQIQNTWQQSSIQLYQNWIDLIESEEINYDKRTIAL
ncbi:homoserine O-acetyltransferase/O-succinyltransferase family protein [Lactobacillaceae bacterium Melli_B4]